ncbi:MAG: FAD-dependent oxidoreductase, partial [Cyclobacteriaceae bacterium]|nr:FAD-dependent oxidoreductase [Cyclobacteriaceae bacterium]
VRAKRIIFCTGTHAKDSKWFHWLPLNRLKGETLEVKLPQQPERIYNRGVYVVPSSTEDLYKVGATYERAPFSEGTTDAAREMLQQQLKELLQMPFEIVHQAWGMRPTTIDRRPILGPHPANKNIIIFNGLGTKGVSLAPYFASRLATWLEGHDTIPDEVNINRFKALYSG